MNHNQDWDMTDLNDYLLYDRWEEQQAWCLLVGLDYLEDHETQHTALDISFNFCPSKETGEKMMRRMRADHLRLRAFWINSNQERDSYAPSSYINWALSKRFSPPWLDWAIKRKLYVPEQGLNSGQLDTTDTIETYTFDPKSTIYPNELELACQAWRAVSSTNGKGTPKERITKWLKDNTDLSNSAIGRISIVANWKKVGGVT